MLRRLPCLNMYSVNVAIWATVKGFSIYRVRNGGLSIVWEPDARAQRLPPPPGVRLRAPARSPCAGPDGIGELAPGQFPPRAPCDWTRNGGEKPRATLASAASPETSTWSIGAPRSPNRTGQVPGSKAVRWSLVVSSSLVTALKSRATTVAPPTRRPVAAGRQFPLHAARRSRAATNG